VIWMKATWSEWLTPKYSGVQTISPAARRVAVWKRSSGGALKVCTMAWWTAADMAAADWGEIFVGRSMRTWLGPSGFWSAKSQTVPAGPTRGNTRRRTMLVPNSHNHEQPTLDLFSRKSALQSLSAVARGRNVSASQVSRALARIESLCAMRLVHRTTHGLSLTNEGGLFLEHAQRILLEHDSLATALARGDAP
jgi:hypothetical protein